MCRTSASAAGLSSWTGCAAGFVRSPSEIRSQITRDSAAYEADGCETASSSGFRGDANLFQQFHIGRELFATRGPLIRAEQIGEEIGRLLRRQRSRVVAGHRLD